MEKKQEPNKDSKEPEQPTKNPEPKKEESSDLFKEEENLLFNIIKNSI